MRFFTAFDKAEEYIRGHLSRHPLFYAFLGGIVVVLFWRGVWETADILANRNDILRWFFYGPNQIVFSTIVLMLMGLLVSVFVGEKIIISGLRHEKQVEDRTEEIIEEEVITLKHIRDEIRVQKAEIHDYKNGAENMGEIKKKK